MADTTEQTVPSKSQRRQRVAALAVIAGVLTATGSGFVVLIVTFAPNLTDQHADTALWMTQAIFASFLLCGLVMGIAGWRLATGDHRGYRPTMAAALVAFLLAGVHIVSWLLSTRTLDYSLMVFTVPLLTYGAIAYVLMDCPPEPAPAGNDPATDAAEPPSDSRDDASG